MNKANLFTPIWITLAVLLALAACQPYTVEPQGGAQVLVPAGTVTLEPYPPRPHSLAGPRCRQTGGRRWIPQSSC